MGKEKEPLISPKVSESNWAKSPKLSEHSKWSKVQSNLD